MKLLKWLDDNFEESILVLMLMMISGIMILQVFMRYVVGNSLSWSEELCRYCYVLTTFLSLSYCIKKNCLLKVDSVLMLFRGRVKTAVLLFLDIICLCLYVYFGYRAIAVVMTTYQSGQTSPALEIPFWLVYCSTILGFFLAALRQIQVAVRRSLELMGIVEPQVGITLAQSAVEETQA